MNLDQLPVEVLTKIFSFLPAYGEVSLVNKLFYNIACQVNDPNICLRIDRKFFNRFISYDVESPEWLDSMHTTTRRIAKVVVIGIENKHLGRQLQYSLKNIATNIKVLIFAYVIIDVSCLLEILSSTSNIERLELADICVNREKRAKSSANQRCTDTLSVNKLKSLLIMACEDPFHTIFNFLPAGILTELKITCDPDELKSILSRQFNVKKLVFQHYQDEEEDNEKFSTDLFNEIELDSLTLTLINVTNVEIATVLMKQTKLKSLTVNSDFFDATAPDDRIMDAIADMSELEELSIDATEFSLGSFAKIQNLKNLKELTLICKGYSAAKQKTLAEWQNASLRKLNLNMLIEVSVECIASWAKSVPNLTELNISASNSQNEYPTKGILDAILRHFNFVEVLSVDIWDEPLVDPSNYFNPKLRELSVVVSSADTFHQQCATKLTTAYPNVKKLKLTIRDSDISEEIIPILNAFTKLESLTVNGLFGLTVTGLDDLHAHKNNLQFLSVEGRQELTDEAINQLRAHFRFIDVDGFTLAVDRRTMNRELKKDF